MKICPKCKNVKNYEEYCKDKTHSDGLSCWCRLCRSKSKKIYYQNLPEHQKQLLRIKNLSSVKKYKNKSKNKRNIHIKNRRKTDISFRLTDNLRARLRSAIKTNQKSGSFVGDLGCSIEQLKRYLESKFKLGMNWSNYGKWHIDHIVPLCYFDLTKREEFLQACHYTNLQPLWAQENYKKWRRKEDEM